MDTKASSELSMWSDSPPSPRQEMTDDEINSKYAQREWRIVTESNRELLPNFVEALKRNEWMNLRPFYQRRQRWDEVRQSRLIESFIMNIPVPPLFVYEADLAKYEVMDGQQRITALREFYADKLVLKGLVQWEEVNGRTYSQLPSEIRKGIDRRSISYIVLLKESAGTLEQQALLRQMVFERLNTGGVALTQQEVRNCLYQGPFNEMLISLATHQLFRKTWGLPAYRDTERESPPKALLKLPFFTQMRDLEVVLRFFALRHVEQYRRGMQGFLDIYMVRAKNFATTDLEYLRALFASTLELGHDIYEDLLFRPWDMKKNAWARKAHVAFADAVMVGLSRHLDDADVLRTKKAAVIEATRELFVQHEDGTFTGRGNTKADVEERIGLYERMLAAAIAG